METLNFFTAVFGGQEGKVVIVLPNILGKPTGDNWFNYPEDLPDMVELVEANEHKDVWFSPIVFKSEARTKENSVSTQVLAADADRCEPENFRWFPNLVIETSQDRYHAYWLLTEPLEAHEAAKINRRIAQVHKDEGCDTAFVNAAKLMRVPGTSNGKHAGEIVIVADYNDKRLTLDKMVGLYPPDEVPDMVEAVAEDMPDGMAERIANTNITDLLTGMPNNVEIRSLMFNHYNDDRRSEILFKLCCLLFEDGHDAETVATLAWHSRSNKFRDEDPRGLKGLWETAVVKAKAAVSTGGPVEYDAPEKKEKYKLTQEPTEFLTLDELEQIAYDPTFIQEWVQWAKSKTDAPLEYHEMAAILLLSTVYSQFGYVHPTHGALKLNIWGVVAGRTTKDRKSTAKSYMERMLRALVTDEYSYILPSDATPGGLEVALQDRAHKSSIISRDEAQGFFEEMLHQSYMSGGISYFTSLYDGRSAGRARASGDKKVVQSVEISFVFYLTGILEDMASVLTVKNFKHGFLTRFLYVIAERPTNYVEPPFTFSDNDEKEEDDKVFNHLKKQLEVGRNYWSMLAPENGMAKIGIEEEAVARFQKFRDDVANKVQDTKYVEVIDAVSDRMTVSVLKLAALLAMHARSSTIKMEHLLHAIAFAGKWFDNAVRVASMISESEWLRDVSLLEKFIEANGNTPYAKAYDAFPDMKQRDFDDMVTSLEMRGVIVRRKVGNRWHLELNDE